VTTFYNFVSIFGTPLLYSITIFIMLRITAFYTCQLNDFSIIIDATRKLLLLLPLQLYFLLVAN